MEIFLEILRYVGGPLLGALIGFFTNWLAVRMLFRPYYPKKIGKWRLPFTPGIIPKRKSALAKAVGKAVGEQLFTKEDLTAVIVSDKVKQAVGERAVELSKSAGDKTAQELMSQFLPSGSRENFIEKAEDFITDRIYSAVQKCDIGSIVADEGAKAINRKKASLGMLAMFLSDGLVSSLTEKLSDGVNSYVAENGREFILKAVKAECESVLGSPISQLTENIDGDIISSLACTVYENAVKHIFTGLEESLNVCAVVEDKINNMDVKELEKLVLSVMKKELNAIVWIGGLIGLILGIVTIFI